MGEPRRAAVGRDGDRRADPLPFAEVEGLAGLTARGEAAERLEGVRDRLPVRW